MTAAEEIYIAMVRSMAKGSDAAIVEALEMLAQGAGNKFRHAAAVVRGTKLGRHSIDDSEALRQLASFPEVRRREAAGSIARKIAGAGATRRQVKSIADRLRRKIK